MRRGVAENVFFFGSSVTAVAVMAESSCCTRAESANSGSVRAELVLGGGSDGGPEGVAVTSMKSTMREMASQSGSPSRQASVSGPTPPEAQSLRTPCFDSGPTCFSSTPRYHAAATSGSAGKSSCGSSGRATPGEDGVRRGGSVSARSKAALISSSPSSPP